MAGYVRVDTSNNIADGNVISATDLDNEFDGVQAGFSASTGHTHGGAAGEGAPITKLGPTQDVTISASLMAPKTTNTVDLGSSSLRYKNLFLAGNAAFTGTLDVTGATTLSGALTYGGVTLSNAVTGTGNMVLSASPTLTGTLTAAAITASGNITGNGNWIIGNADTDTITQGAAYVNGTVLRSSKVATNTLNLAAFDVDGAAYTNLVTLTASNTPTLALTSTGVGTINNMSIGATTASTGAFTTLSASSTVSGTGFSTYLASPPAIGGTTANTGAFTNLSYTGTLTGGTGVVDLGSGQVIKDASGNVGIGITPTQKLHVNGNILTTGSVDCGTQFLGLDTDTAAAPSFSFSSDTDTGMYRVSTNQLGLTTGGTVRLTVTTAQFTATLPWRGQNGTAAAPALSASGDTNTGFFFPAADNLGFSVNGSEQMRLTSTGLGIGTSSPTEKLHVAGALRVTGAQTTAGTGVYLDQTSGTGGVSVYGPDNSTQGTFRIYTATANGGTGSTKLTLDTSGNLGLGVTPSAWHVNFRAYQAGSAGYAAFVGDQSNGRAEVLNNCFASGASTYNYSQSLGATRYSQQLGTHAWFTAPSGTAGNAISFTQAMTLDASGNLGVGTSSPAFKLDVSGVGNFQGVRVGTNGDAINGSTGLLAFQTSGTERARINGAGVVMLGGTTVLNGFGAEDITEFSYVTGAGFCAINSANTNAPLYISRSASAATGALINFATSGTGVGSIGTNGSTTSYNTTSDYRLKTVIGPVANAGQRIDALQPVEYTWNASGERTRGFLAHQFQEVYAGSVSGTKDAVDAEGKPVYQSMQASTSEVIADLVAELQSLRARVAQLESN